MTEEVTIPAELSALGAPVQVFHPRSGAGATGYFAIAGVFLLLAVFALVGIYNPPDHNPPPPIVLISVMSVCGLIALVSMSFGLYAKTYTLALFRDALVRLGDGKPEVFAWADIGQIYEVTNPVAGKQRIVAKDGRKLVIDSGYRDGKILWEHMRQVQVSQMLPREERSFEAGEKLVFGPLRIDRIGIFYKDKQLGWEDISKMQLLYNAYSHRVQFEIRTKDSILLPWCVVAAENIPNLEVFKALAARKAAFT